MKMSSPSGDINVALNLIGFIDYMLLVAGSKQNNKVQDLL